MTVDRTEGEPVPDHLRQHIHSAERLVVELHQTQQRNARLRAEIAEMRRQLDHRQPPPDVAKLERECERLRSGIERSKHKGESFKDALADLVSLSRPWARILNDSADDNPVTRRQAFFDWQSALWSASAALESDDA